MHMFGLMPGQHDCPKDARGPGKQKNKRSNMGGIVGKSLTLPSGRNQSYPKNTLRIQKKKQKLNWFQPQGERRKSHLKS